MPKLYANKQTVFKKLIIFSLFNIISIYLFSQISTSGYPPSWTFSYLKSATVIPAYNLKSFDSEKLLAEDLTADAPLRYSIFEETSINIKNLGIREDLQTEKGTIWRYRIESDNALSLLLDFKLYNLPNGARLFIYNDTRSLLLGAFTNINVRNDKGFTVGDFHSDHLIIEYFEPWESDFQGELIIGMVGKAYRDIFSGSADENGLVGINCYEGKDLQNQKHSVCRITFRSGDEGYLCTGALINNTGNDGTPYFLTSNHCISDTAAAKTMVTYFNYENAGCNDDALIPLGTLSGAKLLSTGKRSDYTLLLLNDIPPVSYQPYYAGWDASGIITETSAGIHHASGGTKKVSLDFSPVVNVDEIVRWSETNYSPANSHWLVRFDNGKTMDGSSGSPLFDKNGRIIGQLHGGDDNVDLYGKLSYSWEQSNWPLPTLKSYLDPENTNVKSLDAYYPVQNLPDSRFTTEFNSVCTEGEVRLLNISAFETNSWEWTFTPGTVEFLEGTNIYSENPVVSFKEPGYYDVKLISANIAGASSRQLNNYILSGDDLNVNALPVYFTSDCLCDFDSVSFLASGGSSYSWELDYNADPGFYFANTDDTIATVKYSNPLINDTITRVSLNLTAYHGICQETANFIFPLISQPNDNISDAIKINVGYNGPFSNKCATTETNEPVPPHNSCTGQLSWCDEFPSDILMNSIWFYFTAPESGIISISSEGMDNEIAVYEADNWFDLIADNYNLIAANDDRSPADYNPLINGLSVNPGETYWVQVDGSAGGAEGEFTLLLEDKKLITNIEDYEIRELLIYPQPSNDIITIEAEGFTPGNMVDIQVYSSTGIKIFTDNLLADAGNKLTLKIGEWAPGIYIVNIKSGSDNYQGKFTILNR